ASSTEGTGPRARSTSPAATGPALASEPAERSAPRSTDRTAADTIRLPADTGNPAPGAGPQAASQPAAPGTPALPVAGERAASAQAAAVAAAARNEPLPSADATATVQALPPLPGAASSTLPGTTSVAATVPAEARVPVPLDNPGFGAALGAQVSVLVRDGVQTARLQLNPAEMGPIAVQIALDGSAARVDFQADLAGTRAVIEASLPALAGALQDAGFTLAGGGVFQQTPGRQGQGDAQPQPGQARQADNGRTGDANPQAGATVLRSQRGLVDLVA
ncbi:flagellar hook-length control protein FliK, partial [Pseudaquabacterium pictum]|uniref:flagellar hook-length control protein FliK n=1 Tax=Pseudaquabacterium pictum TaxID=2315236 RepID=UPI001575EA68